MSSNHGSASLSSSAGFGASGFDNGGLQGLGTESVAKSCVIAGTRLVFELEWSPTQNRSAPDAEFQRARKLGYNFATMLPDKSLIGLAKAVQAGSGKPHAAVVMLVERFCSGGAEAVLISVGQRGVAFVGLMDRRPVPGFDRLLSGLDAALALLKEFRDIHIDQDVRVATDLGDTIPNSEVLQTQTVFEMPEAGSLVRPLINRALRRTVLGGGTAAVVLSAALGSFLWSQHQQRKAADEAARLARENDPNRQYEANINAMLARAGIPGNVVLDQWRGLLNRLPITREGWALQRFECTQASRECVATWTRNYGNFQDFLTRPPVGVREPRFGTLSNNNDVLGASMTTFHSWDVADQQANHQSDHQALARPTLPRVGEVPETWGSRLQDLALAAGGAANVTSLKPARLFGPSSVTSLQAIQQPVVAMEWRIVDGMWSLPAIDLPPSAVPESLTVQLAPTQITYTLTGNVYAKGKSY
ncbi:Pilin accessory protein (PilO) [Roseateles sp. YR242]|uniref:type 4b pilus protein PilO2 n=1 Tax=Roseateles sp. YR242 TaxID=1855305 RepID=UPI0008B94786|nr:type 4b pilus protein PilO2 [Roseateles sp. YR242]SEL08541.1 Pilin accessory protein (PilO) [Roseateles sp. YR242]